MKKVIYILKHQDRSFSGYIHGVKFCHGQGSTSSNTDMLFLTNPQIDRETQKQKKAVCEDITEEYWKKKKQEEAMKKAREAKGGKKDDKPEAEDKIPYSKKAK